MKILVVDDELDVQSLFEQRFRREIRSGAFELIFAHSGEDALGLMREHFSEIVLILSDINMPGMTGIQFLKQIKAEHPIVPPFVMMITAYGDSDNYNEAMSAGADDFLNKPLDFNDLKEKIQQAQLKITQN